jgi:predicted phosphodiesterase
MGISMMRRRTFITGSTLIISSPLALAIQREETTQPTFSIGLITDVHYADKSPGGSRHYRESLKKIEEASDAFQQNNLQITVELGDLIDAADSVSTEMSYLKTINRKFESLSPKRHYVLGNHCVDTLTKEEFLGEVGQKESYYSFDAGGYHFVILDSCYTSDGTPYGRKNFRWTDANVPEHEIDWLRADLASTDLPTIVFAHQRIDVETNHGVRNGSQVRNTLEKSGRVQAVFQGHSHQNDLKTINQIPYCTCVAMVEGSGEAENGYSILDFYPNQTLRLKGFRKQANRDLSRSI